MEIKSLWLPQLCCRKSSLLMWQIKTNMICAMNSIPKRAARDAGEKDQYEKKKKKACEKNSKRNSGNKCDVRNILVSFIYLKICHLLSILTLSHPQLSPISHHHFFYNVLFGDFSSISEYLTNTSSLSFQVTLRNLGWEFSPEPPELIQKFHPLLWGLFQRKRNNNWLYWPKFLGIFKEWKFLLNTNGIKSPRQQINHNFGKELEFRTIINPLSIRSHSPLGKFWVISLVLDSQLDGSYQKYHALVINYHYKLLILI